MKIPFRYKIFEIINRSLMKGRNIVIFRRHPLVIIRNYLNSIFFKFLSCSGQIIVDTDKGFKLAVRMDDQAAASFLFNTGYSPNETDYIVRHVGICETFVDIGASYGYFSFLAETVGFKNILTFEPNPLLVPLIELSIKINNFKKIKLFPIAISNVKKRLPMVFSSYETSSGSICIENTSGKKIMHHVDTDYLDNYIDLIEPPAFIKIDVEGHELRALYGMSTILKHIKPTLLWEATHSDVYDILAYLNKYGYKHYNIIDKKLVAYKNNLKLMSEMVVSRYHSN